MQPVVVTMSITLDGYGTGRGQTRDRPFGDLPEGVLHSWMEEDAEVNREAMEAIVDAGAFIMGRNMFGPVRGEWTGNWRGWWGPNPPYHRPVFVLTHHPRESVEMEGGTTYHFVTDGIHAALERAREVAGDQDIHVAGGPRTANAYLAAGLVDELRLQIAPGIVGGGERLFEGVGPLDLEQISSESTPLVTHVHYRVRRPDAAPAEGPGR